MHHPALTIRPARAEEAPTIRDLVRQARLDPTQLRWNQFLIAEAEGQLVGIGQLRRYGAVQELGSLVVVPDWRSRGVGRALIQALVTHRTGPLFLECAAHLAPYYETAGFQRVPWYRVPWPLKAKFALSTTVASFFGGVATLRFEDAVEERG